MTDSDPTVSVIIPVYNDPAGLQTTVESLLAQTAEGYEVIIADNGSTDRTRALAAEYATRERVRHTVEDEIQGSYAARNAGIEATEGDILAFIDADMWVESDWVESIRKRVESGTRYLGCNVVVVAETDGLVARYNKQSAFPVETYLEQSNFAPTCCLVVHRTVIEDVGPFDERLFSGGDGEFGQRVHDAGYRQEFVEDIQMYHPARESLAELITKHHRVGRGIIQRARYHPAKFDHRHPLHPFGFLPVRPSVIAALFPDARRTQQVLYFLIAYLLKLSSTAGRIREWQHPTRIS